MTLRRSGGSVVGAARTSRMVAELTAVASLLDKSAYEATACSLAPDTEVRLDLERVYVVSILHGRRKPDTNLKVAQWDFHIWEALQPLRPCKFVWIRSLFQWLRWQQVQSPGDFSEPSDLLGPRRGPDFYTESHASPEGWIV